MKVDTTSFFPNVSIPNDTIPNRRFPKYDNPDLLSAIYFYYTKSPWSRPRDTPFGSGNSLLGLGKSGNRCSREIDAVRKSMQSGLVHLGLVHSGKRCRANLKGKKIATCFFWRKWKKFARSDWRGKGFEPGIAYKKPAHYKIYFIAIWIIDLFLLVCHAYEKREPKGQGPRAKSRVPNHHF